MRKGIAMISRERDLLYTILNSPRENKKAILYLSVSGICVGLVFLVNIIR